MTTSTKRHLTFFAFVVLALIFGYTLGIII